MQPTPTSLPGPRRCVCCVPYYERNLTMPYTSPQISADELYAHMVGDIEAAIALNALPFRASDKEAGRVTTAMAYMLYA